MHQLDLIDTYGIFHSTIAESYSLKTCLQIGKRNFVLMIFKSQMKQKCPLKDIKYHSFLKKNISNLNPLKEVYYYFFNFTKKHQNHLNSHMNFRKTFREEIIHILDNPFRNHRGNTNLHYEAHTSSATETNKNITQNKSQVMNIYSKAFKRGN